MWYCENVNKMCLRIKVDRGLLKKQIGYFCSHILTLNINHYDEKITSNCGYFSNGCWGLGAGRYYLITHRKNS